MTERRAGPAPRSRAASGRRAMVALLVGAVVGVAVLGAFYFYKLQIQDPPDNTWGIVNGSVAFVATAGLTLALIGGVTQRRIGAAVLGLVATVVSVAVWLLIVAFGLSPFQLSGGWLWPLAIAATAVAVGALRRALSPRRAPGSTGAAQSDGTTVSDERGRGEAE